MSEARTFEAAPPFLEVVQLSKRFANVRALRDVTMAVRCGEVHGLVGANGAGKSTLVRILAGVHQPDAGQIAIDGDVVVIRDPSHSADLGLNFIHQELNLVPKLTALQNLTLGLEKKRRFGVIDWRGTARAVKHAVDRLKIDFDLNTPVEELSVADQWLISMARALVRNARLIAMDEPTASLSDEESQRLFRIIRDLAAGGVAILYVSHRLDEITTLCDRVTVFRDGGLVLTMERAEVKKDELVRQIVGRQLESTTIDHSATAPRGRELLRVESLRKPPMVHDVSFAVHENEVLGVAGLVGSGRTEMARLIFGADRMHSGSVYFDGKHVPKPTTDRSVAMGLAFVPEERRSQGLVLAESVNFNSNLATLQATRARSRLPLVSRRKARARALSVVKDLDVRPASVDSSVHALSGGNQQKVVLGKWLLLEPRVMILDEPTRGVDVGARADIYRIIRNMAASGRGVVVISSDFEEFHLCCDRVLVMVEGRIVGELTGDDINEERILELSYSHGAHP